MKKYIFLFFLSVFLLTAGGHLYRHDGYALYLTTRSISKGHFYIPELPNYSVAGKDGKFYAIYEIGYPLAGVPLLLLGSILDKLLNTYFYSQVFYSFTNCFLSAFLCLLFWSFCMETGLSKRSSFFLTGVLAFSTPIWPYSKFDGYEILAALLLLLILFYLYKFEKTENFIYLKKASLFFGFSIFARITLVSLLPCFIFYLYRKGYTAKSNLKRFFVFLLPFTISILILLFFNYVRFDRIILDPRQIFYQAGRFQGFNLKIFEAFFERLISPAKGVFVYSPVLLVGFFYIKKIISDKLGFVSLIIALYFVFIHGFVNSTDEWCWGPRYALTVVPVFFLSICPIYKELVKSKKKGFFLLFLAILGFFINFSAVAVNQINYFLEHPGLTTQEALKNNVFSIRKSHLSYQLKSLYFQLYRINRFNSFDFWFIHLYNYCKKKVFIILACLGIFFTGIYSLRMILVEI